MGFQYATALMTPDISAGGLRDIVPVAHFDGSIFSRPRSAFACGLVAGLAFLAKSYALPFVLAHYAVSSVLRRLSGKMERGPRALVIACWLAGLSVFAAPWIAALTWKYGQLTVSTTAGINHAIVAPDHQYGLHAEAGFRVIPKNVLSDPWLSGNEYPYWHPFDSLANLVHQLKISAVNLFVIRNYLAIFHQDGLFSAALIASFLLSWLRAGGGYGATVRPGRSPPSPST